MTLYPLKFKPIIKDYLWGGTRLQEVLHKEVCTDTAAESWEVSAIKDNVSVVQEGALQGRDLKELVLSFGKDLLGEHVHRQFGNEFPVLIKFIDAEKDLSVQLHPNDALARERHNSFGKTEMWHVMQAEKDAELIIGFKRDTNREEFLDILQKGRLIELLNLEKVTPGDTFLINTGMVHAIGAGVLLVEIQQTSNITYRIYDYNRKDKDGKTRELHTEMAMEAINFESDNDFRIRYEHSPNKVNSMIESPFFITNYLHVTQNLDLDVTSRDSFHIYVCTEGEATFITDTGNYDLKMGETLLIPACIGNFTIISSGAKFLEVHL